VLVANSDAAVTPGTDRTSSTSDGGSPPVDDDSTRSARRLSWNASFDTATDVVCR
jgi:hypothetical protein